MNMAVSAPEELDLIRKSIKKHYVQGFLNHIGERWMKKRLIPKISFKH